MTFQAKRHVSVFEPRQEIQWWIISKGKIPKAFLPNKATTTFNTTLNDHTFESYHDHDSGDDDDNNNINGTNNNNNGYNNTYSFVHIVFSHQ